MRINDHVSIRYKFAKKIKTKVSDLVQIHKNRTIKNLNFVHKITSIRHVYSRNFSIDSNNTHNRDNNQDKKVQNKFNISVEMIKKLSRDKKMKD